MHVHVIEELEHRDYLGIPLGLLMDITMVITCKVGIQGYLPHL